jgi:hypothetical protein
LEFDFKSTTVAFLTGRSVSFIRVHLC